MTGMVPAVLRVLARLVPTERPVPRAATVDLQMLDPPAVWLGYAGMWSAGPVDGPPASSPAKRPVGGRWISPNAPPVTSLRDGPVELPASAGLNRLAAVDQLRYEDRVLRAGWTVLAGQMLTNAGQKHVCTPLASWPVRLLPHPDGGFDLMIAGDLEITPLVSDRARAEQLADGAQFCAGGLSAEMDMRAMPLYGGWVNQVCAAAGLPEPVIRPPALNPLTTSGRVLDGLVATAGIVLYAASTVDSTEVGATLWEWSTRSGVEQCALAQLYRVGQAPAPAPALDHIPILSPLPLSQVQQDVARAARTGSLTVVSGPPGCGKTHTLTAIALDAVAEGKSVLVATRSRYAAEVLGGMLRRAAGPTPVLFGDTELRRAVAEELAEGLPPPAPPEELAARTEALADSAQGVQRLEREVGAALADETAAERAARDLELIAAHRASAPRLFDAKLDVATVTAAIVSARRIGGGQQSRGWWSRLRSKRALRRLRSLAGAMAGLPLPDIEAAFAAAQDQRTALRVQLAGGIALDGLRTSLLAADCDLRAAAACWIDAQTSAGDHRTPVSRRAVADLAAALRAGRGTRRRLLAQIAGPELVRALPLWVGTLGDVEDLLPPIAGLFDLIIIDEASHVDQPTAAPALVRARRAVVAGDPRQLRHVSFVSGVQVAAAVAAEHAEAVAGLLDIGRMSLFDVAAAGAVVHWLEDHHRCAPNVIGFAAERFYPKRLKLLTTHPSIATLDCIDVERVVGQRDERGANPAEVAAAVAYARLRVDGGATSVGLLSPFRAQANAVERAVLDEFTVQEITRARLRVGTVHSFQGSECDELVVSFTLTDSDSAASWRFVDDPHLLAVLTTRARQRVHLITSASAPAGLVGAYLAYADRPPAVTVGIPGSDPWTVALSAELNRVGAEVRDGYPVGSWRIDLVVGAHESAVALETRPHPNGIEAHLNRWRALAGAGWQIHDAYPTRFGHDPARAAIALPGELEALP